MRAVLACFFLCSQATDTSCGLHGQEVDTSSHEEDLDSLEFALLQTSLKIASVKSQITSDLNVSNMSEETSSASLLSSSFEESLRGEAQRFRKAVALHTSFLMNLRSDPSSLGGIPALLVFMLAAIVMVVFVVQTISFSVEDKVTKEDDPKMAGWGYERFRAANSRDWNTALRPSPGNPYTTFGPDGQERDTVGAPSSLPPLTVPHSQRSSMASRPVSQATLGRQALTSYSTQHLEPRSLDPRSSEAMRTGSLPRSSQAGLPDTAAMCPNLILAHAEAQFSIPTESLRILRTGSGPVGVLGGQTGRPLLHARFSPPSDGSGGLWLELSTTATSRFPHCSAGPLRLPFSQRSGENSLLEIRGPKGDTFGKLAQARGGWQLTRNSQLTMSFASDPRGLALVATAEGQSIATVSGHGDDALRIQVSPGVDPLLTLLCMLAITLLSPGSP
mmetsp:Transcript_686/g.1156  ORF Transcript_686/g.1156 Transcript_686/m.1156 type:complete len:446 (-) Transcript_686:160-1497(-)